MNDDLTWKVGDLEKDKDNTANPQEQSRHEIEKLERKVSSLEGWHFPNYLLMNLRKPRMVNRLFLIMIRTVELIYSQSKQSVIRCLSICVYCTGLKCTALSWSVIYLLLIFSFYF